MQERSVALREGRSVPRPQQGLSARPCQAAAVSSAGGPGVSAAEAARRLRLSRHLAFGRAKETTVLVQLAAVLLLLAVGQHALARGYSRFSPEDGVPKVLRFPRSDRSGSTACTAERMFNTCQVRCGSVCLSLEGMPTFGICASADVPLQMFERYIEAVFLSYQGCSFGRIFQLAWGCSSVVERLVRNQ